MAPFRVLLVSLACGNLRSAPDDELRSFSDMPAHFAGQSDSANAAEWNETKPVSLTQNHRKKGRKRVYRNDVTIAYSETAEKLMGAFQVCGKCKASSMIRVGEQTRDGGYLMCPDTLEKVDVAYSIGIRGFDGWGIHVSALSGASVHEFDCTDPSKPRCPVDATAAKEKDLTEIAAVGKGKACDLHFNLVCIGDDDGKSSHVFEQLDAAVQRTAPAGSKDLALKIDCEGCEWGVFDELSEEQLTRFKTITAEFHLIHEQLNHEQYLRVMEKLTKHFRIIHTHGCNCRGLWSIKDYGLKMPQVVETSFVRMDWSDEMSCVGSAYSEEFDHPICHAAAEIRADNFKLVHESASSAQ